MLGSSRIGGSGAIIAGVNAPKRTCPYGTVGQIGGRGIAWVRRRCATMQCPELLHQGTLRAAGLFGTACRRITGHVRVKRDLIGNGDAVLLVDDIVTTGATVRQCVQAFQQAGTKVVGVLVLADAVVRRSDDDING